jgi:hypothetical protein
MVLLALHHRPVLLMQDRSRQVASVGYEKRAHRQMREWSTRVPDKQADLPSGNGISNQPTGKFLRQLVALIR